MTVGFATGSEKLDEDAKDKVEAFAEKHREVLDGETFTLTLIGHASRTGSPGLNYELSDARRLSVQGAIEHKLEHGIEKHVDGPALGEQLAAAEKMPGDDDSARYRVVEVILVGSTTEEVP
jgi:outer membrane protein OmpA-like peptidoglycan-associated protein